MTLDDLCNPDSFGSLGWGQVQLQQPQGVVQPFTGDASSTGFRATCDDQKHSLTVTIPHGIGPGFQPGNASAETRVSDASGISSAETQAEVTLK